MKTWKTVLTVVGIVAAVAAVGAGLYCYLTGEDIDDDIYDAM